jgi:transposase
MADLFGVPMSVGSISQSEKTTTAVVAEPVQEARDYVEAQSVVHLDEMSWREGGKRAWLWVAVPSLVTVFLIRISRSGQVAGELLGEGFSGILVTDRYSAYNWYPVRWRQLCGSHLLRDVEAIRGRGGASEEIGDALRDGTLARSTFRSYMTPLCRGNCSGYVVKTGIMPPFVTSVRWPEAEKERVHHATRPHGRR